MRKPDIFDETNGIVAFQTENLMEPLMQLYPAAEIFSYMSELTQMAMTSNLIALMNTEVFHDVWREHLETHGSLEGLLRCAIATPAEFALVHSFFEDTAALEKWIQAPLKTENGTEERKDKMD